MIKPQAVRLLVATHKQGKLSEFADILGYRSIDWVTLDEAGVREDVEETGLTFLENAILKASSYANQTGLLTLADDSGLEVDALGGKPGVLTARYGGPGLSAADRYRLLLANMVDIPEGRRTARFRCAIAVSAPDGIILGTAEGICDGVIAFQPEGQNGFGYDPVFFLPDYGLTMAQLDSVEKHRISHRGKAIIGIAPLLQNLLYASG